MSDFRERLASFTTDGLEVQIQRLEDVIAADKEQTEDLSQRLKRSKKNLEVRASLLTELSTELEARHRDVVYGNQPISEGPADYVVVGEPD